MILLIDNDEFFRERMQQVLQGFDDEVVARASVSELPPLSELREPVAAVIRYELPDEDGLTFADRFHLAYPSVPVFLLTGVWSPYLAQQAAARSFLWVRQVPVGYEEICALIVSVHASRDRQVPARMDDRRDPANA